MRYRKVFPNLVSSFTLLKGANLFKSIFKHTTRKRFLEGYLNSFSTKETHNRQKEDSDAGKSFIHFDFKRTSQGPIQVNFSRLDDFLKKFLETGNHGKPVKPEIARFLILVRTIADFGQRLEDLEERINTLEGIINAFFRPGREVTYPILFVDPDSRDKELEELAAVAGASIIEVRDKAHLIEITGSPVLPALVLDPNKIAYGERTCKLFLESLAGPVEQPIRPKDIPFKVGGS